MNVEQISLKARKHWTGRTIGILALGILLCGIPALAQQDQQNPPATAPANSQAGAPANSPAKVPQTQQDQAMPQQPAQQAQDDQQAQQDQQQQQDQSAPQQQSQQGQVEASNKISKHRRRINPAPYRQLPHRNISSKLLRRNNTRACALRICRTI